MTRPTGMRGGGSPGPATALSVAAIGVTGLPGAANPGRFVGVTATGAPTSGTFRLADYVITQNGQIFVCTAAGSPGLWASPRDVTGLLSSGEETLPRIAATSNSNPTANQSLRLTFFTARKTETTTQVRVLSGGTAAGATPTLCRVGLYLVDSAGDGTLVASIANDTALFASTNAAYTRSWTVPYAKVAGQRYALGLLIVTGAATPTIPGVSSILAAAGETVLAPMVSGTLAGQADLPASFTAASIAAIGGILYGVVLP